MHRILQQKHIAPRLRSPLRQALQDLEGNIPEGRYRAHIHPLVWGVRAADIGPEADGLHAGELLAQDTTFQTGVDGADLKKTKKMKKCKK